MRRKVIKTNRSAYGRHYQVMTGSLLLSLKSAQSLHSTGTNIRGWNLEVNKEAWEEVRDHIAGDRTRNRHNVKETGRPQCGLESKLVYLIYILVKIKRKICKWAVHVMCWWFIFIYRMGAKGCALDDGIWRDDIGKFAGIGWCQLAQG